MASTELAAELLRSLDELAELRRDPGDLLVIRRTRDRDLVAALGGVEEYDRAVEEWEQRIRRPDGSWPARNPDMHRRLYLEGLARERAGRTE